MAGFWQDTKAALGDRRIQLGGAAAVAAMAVCGLAVAGADRLRPQDTGPEMADHARLAIQIETPRPAPALQPVGRLATLDPSQADAARAAPDPVDPALQAMVDQERREAAQAVAEQRAFDARIRAEMNGDADTPRTAPPVQSDPPAQHSGWTSNSEDAAPGA